MTSARAREDFNFLPQKIQLFRIGKQSEPEGCRSMAGILFQISKKSTKQIGMAFHLRDVRHRDKSRNAERGER